MATSAQLRREILAGQWDEALCTLYGTEPAVLARPREAGGGAGGYNAGGFTASKRADVGYGNGGYGGGRY